MDVIACPHEGSDTRGPVEDHGAYEFCTLVEGQYFTVTRWNVKTDAAVSQDYPFLLIDVASGSGTLDGIPVKAGDHLLAPAGYGVIRAEGAMELIASHITEKH